MKVMTRGVAGSLLVMCAGFCWGTSGTIAAFAPAGATSWTIGAARVVGTAAILGCITAVRNPRRFMAQRWAPLPVFLAGFGLALYQLAFFAAVQRTGAGIAAIIAIGSAPAMAGAMSRIFFGEVLSRRWLVSTCAAVCGGVLLAMGGGAESGSADPLGVCLAVLSGFAYSLEGIGIRMLGRDHESLDITTAIFLASALLSLPFLVTRESAWIPTLHGLVFLLFLAGISSALAFALFTRGLIIVGVARSYTLGLTEPLTAWILSTLVLGQELAPLALIGGALILAAVLFLVPELRDE